MEKAGIIRKSAQERIIQKVLNEDYRSPARLSELVYSGKSQNKETGTLGKRLGKVLSSLFNIMIS